MAEQPQNVVIIIAAISATGIILDTFSDKIVFFIFVFPPDILSDVLIVPDWLVVDFKGYTICINDVEIKVTPKEFEVLSYLIKNKNIAVSREALLSSIWGYDFFGDDRTIDTHVKMLRNNLGKYRDLITTVRGVGYKFEIKEK